jgi:glycerol-3-phosphate acyltransferase PlsY
MDLLYKILILVGGMILGYLIGSLSFSLIIGLNFYKKDVRQYGSKNAGGTNATRVLGKKAGFTVMFFDVLKAIVVYWTITMVLRYTALGAYAWVAPTVYLSIFATALGHAYPIFYGFKGGKVVSIFAGFALATNWVVTLISMVIFFGLLGWKKMVSLASVSTALAFILYSWIFFIPEVFAFSMFPAGTNDPIWFVSIFLALSLLLIVRHRANIKRILSGTERKIGDPKI